jgi:hypothetical protein
MKKAKPRKLVGRKLTEALDEIVRRILHSQNPYPVCFVCGRHDVWFHPKTAPHGIQVGHYISRRVYPLRWDLKNIWPQCAGDNKTHQWNTLPFTSRIIEVCGKERIEYLQKKYHGYKDVKMSTCEKRALLVTLEKLFLDLQHSV